MHKHASAISDDPSNITVSGLSAGAQSAHAQVLHEFILQKAVTFYRPIIKRCLLRSGTALLPCNDFREVKEQLDELCHDVGVQMVNGLDVIESLRRATSIQLIDAIGHMKRDSFRAINDGGPHEGGFVSDEWRQDMKSGAFSKWCKQHNISFVIGEVADEDRLYRLINPPKEFPTFKDGPLSELSNYCTADVVQKLLTLHKLPPDSANAEAWADIFGDVTSDAQVFSAVLLLLRYLVYAKQAMMLGPEDVFRFRLECCAGYFDLLMPPEMGVYHGTCDAIFKYLKDAIDAALVATEAAADLAAFRRWLQPVRSWIAGDCTKAAQEWYDGQKIEGGYVRTIREMA